MSDTPKPKRALTRADEVLVLRALAKAMGLPRICAVKACRRRKRCRGAGIVCLKHHSGLARRRLGAAVRPLVRSDA
jgi:hypothetical protein